MTLSDDRMHRLNDELKFALKNTPSNELREWANDIPKTFGILLIRRGRNFANLVMSVENFLAREGRGLASAVSKDRTADHLRDRGKSASEATMRTWEETKARFEKLQSAINANPRDSVPAIAVSVFGFVLGSGGIDGDGGVPDLDFIGGIGGHRSIFTHSVISGAVIETILLSTVALARCVHSNLPEHHDPLWEELVEGGEKLTGNFAAGISAGISYHLGIDATLDGGGTYKDLPFSLPIEGHQLIEAGNALAEGLDVAKRKLGNLHELALDRRK